MDTVYAEVGPYGEPELTPHPGPEGCGACLQDKGTQLVNWAYVGEGKGDFQPVVQAYNYVGNGLGSYEREVVVTPGTWNMRKVYICICLAMTLLCILGVCAALTVGKGSQTVVETPAPTISYDCESGVENWATEWNLDKRDWCCANLGVACKPAERGCQTDCDYRGRTATCAARVQWGATHRFKFQPNACAQAFDMVMGQCPYCTGSCQLADADCKPLPVQQ